KILGGAYTPSSGTVQIGEQVMAFKNAADSIANGVAVIHQELHLVPEMTVAENLFLGHLPSRFGVVNGGQLRKQALACLKGLADEIDPQEKLGRLS
ncbi:L-arabinose ABC transporter ATP-binding protein AraG, partial [Salmonella enterica subsp. enterica serovar 1,4,[5],12:i:-]|nr:L-arabinose ABC transporter ATP-binding protein AraG [Salmonella enterica subsp. enterica serovar 1,4,[5],12:i:-]